MEYVWYIIASLGAGVGTGLAGLSAATVMVPILLVLCPSFHGETGAYQATAIALASDILGSAVTTMTYAKNKNIDLKRGRVMLICILGMCTIGSYAAWLAGNVVLGSFTLFLTFFIGIRFLVKPDTSRTSTAARGGALGMREIAISLFFGLTIGFGSGFVGTGGGMMMLVVFTAFLGMDLKTAVGTSTFIMTFTALIASVSHILIHPAILTARWDVLLICITVATAASLGSARFANRVSARTIGLATGAVLTVLGAGMLLIQFGDVWTGNASIAALLLCLWHFVQLIVPCVLVLLFIRFVLRPPRFVFRKLLHVVAFSCGAFLILRENSWLTSSRAFAAIAVLLYPVLAALEKTTWFSSLLVEKKSGEIKRSLLLLFFMFAVITAVGAGIFGRSELVVAAIIMWGMGDAAAALVGIPFGRHKVKFRPVNGRKSWEGFLAMAFTAGASGAVVLHFCHAESLFAWPLLTAALTGAFVELISPSELDTATVPSAVLAVLLIML